MTFKELKKKIKEEQKALAQKITRGKSLRKPKNQINLTSIDKKFYFYTYPSSGEFFNESSISSLSSEYRHKHIAYCDMFFNTPYEKIEKKVKEGNKPDKFRLHSIKQNWIKELDEALCYCA